MWEGNSGGLFQVFIGPLWRLLPFDSPVFSWSLIPLGWLPSQRPARLSPSYTLITNFSFFAPCCTRLASHHPLWRVRGWTFTCYARLVTILQIFSFLWLFYLIPTPVFSLSAGNFCVLCREIETTRPAFLKLAANINRALIFFSSVSKEKLFLLLTKVNPPTYVMHFSSPFLNISLHH